MPIDPKRLRRLREGKRLTRNELAAKSTISVRTIARLESETATATTPQERTVNKIAKALGVEPGVLTGELPLPDATGHLRPEGGQRRQVSAQLQPEVISAYALIKWRYGLGLPTLVNAAPLLFVLLAESSFVWRREKAEEAREAANLLRGLGLGNQNFWIAAGKAENAAVAEEDSISPRDPFGETLFEEGIYDEGYDPYRDNPFADYLRALAKKIGDPKIVEIGEDIEARGPLKNFPNFTICNGDVDEFTCGNERYRLALGMGWLRADSIPEDLLAEDAGEKRQEWFEEQISEKAKPLLEQLMSLDLGPSEANGGESDR